MKRIHPKDFRKGQYIKFFTKQNKLWQAGYAIIKRGTKDGTFVYVYSTWKNLSILIQESKCIQNQTFGITTNSIECQKLKST